MPSPRRTLRLLDVHPLLALAIALVALWAIARAGELLVSIVVAVVLFVALVGVDDAMATLNAVRSWLAP